MKERWFVLALVLCGLGSAPGLVHGQTTPPKSDVDELEATVKLMTKIGSCHGASFAPDGKQLAFLSDLNGLPQVWVVPVEGGWPKLIVTFDDAVTMVACAPNEAWLSLYVVLDGGMDRH